MEHINVMP